MTYGQITLTGIRAHANHGVLASERELGQPFSVDVSLDVDDVSSFDNEVASVADGHLRIGPHASVRERVRSDVDDPHDEGAGGMRVGSRADIDHAVESRTASQALIEVCGESLTCTPH
jgi:hypothetical protein